MRLESTLRRELMITALGRGQFNASRFTLLVTSPWNLQNAGNATTKGRRWQRRPHRHTLWRRLHLISSLGLPPSREPPWSPPVSILLTFSPLHNAHLSNIMGLVSQPSVAPWERWTSVLCGALLLLRAKRQLWRAVWCLKRAATCP